jgi:hypothetical protein
MENEHYIENVISPTLPDSEVPEEKVETASSIRHKKIRSGRFLKGPISLSWIRDYIRDPADRLLLVLRAHSDMRQSRELKVSADIQRDAGVEDRKVLYRALAALEKSGIFEKVIRRKGRRTRVKFSDYQT